jgi:hypothetical protein
MKFSDFLDKQVIEEAVFSYKYTFNIKNIKDLFNHIKGWKDIDTVPEMEGSKTINLYNRAEEIKGTIKDKGKAFVLDTKDKLLKSVIEKGM